MAATWMHSAILVTWVTSLLMKMVMLPVRFWPEFRSKENWELSAAQSSFMPVKTTWAPEVTMVPVLLEMLVFALPVVPSKKLISHYGIVHWNVSKQQINIARGCVPGPRLFYVAS